MRTTVLEHVKDEMASQPLRLRQDTHSIKAPSVHRLRPKTFDADDVWPRGVCRVVYEVTFCSTLFFHLNIPLLSTKTLLRYHVALHPQYTVSSVHLQQYNSQIPREDRQRRHNKVDASQEGISE